MKKIFLLLISALLIFCLVACDKFSTSSKDKDDDTESGEEMENSGSELGESGTLDTEDSYTQGSVSTPDTWNSGSAMGSSVTTDTSGVDRENEIAVAFKLNGGTLHTGRTVVYLEKGSVIDVNIIPITTKDGSEFLGWAYDSNGLNMWDISHSFDKDTVLYAIWDVKTVSVSFDANGGETVTGSSFAEIKLGEALSGVPAVVREGFVFKGFCCWNKKIKLKKICEYMYMCL